jgi:hypothetical protein
MAELSFIDGTPDSINIEQLLAGAREISDILADDDEVEPYDADTIENARADLKSLQEILAELGYSVETPEEVVDALESVGRETSGEFIEEGQLEQVARNRYEDESWSSIISSNINWQGVVDDMTEGVYEMTINNGTYYDA